MVHIQRLAFITEEEMEAVVKEWKVKRLDKTTPGRGGRSLVPARDKSDGLEGKLNLAAKSKGKKPKDTERRASQEEESESFQEETDEEDQDVEGRMQSPRAGGGEHQGHLEGGLRTPEVV